MNRPPLPASIVETLFARLAVRYGRAFIGMYEGIDPAHVKADWARELAGFVVQREDEPFTAPAIFWALDNLPEKTLNAGQFRMLCLQWRDPGGQKALPAPPRPIPRQVALAIEKRHEAPDTRPEAHRVASRVVARLMVKDKLTPAETSNLNHYTKVLRRYESVPDLEGAKKRAAAATAARLAQDSPDNNGEPQQ